jgi:hypothetical protein
VGTLPVHFDPAWWCAGYPVQFNKARELMILWSNIKFSIYAFRCPALFLILICLPFGVRNMARRLAQTWFMVGPALVFALIYCFVFSDYRYLAGSYAVIGFALIAATWNVQIPRQARRMAIVAIPLLSAAVSMGEPFRHLLPDFISDVTGTRVPHGYAHIQAAETMRKAGLASGDRVAYIGFALGAVHVGLEQAHIVAAVPERITHDDNAWGRPLVQEKVFEAFRSVGAKWVFADTVPKWADITGWKLMAHMDPRTYRVRSGDRQYMYYRKLQ